MSVDVIVAVLALLGIVYVAWRDRNSAGDSLVKDAMTMLDKLQEQVERLEQRDEEREKEMKAMRAEIAWYKHGVDKLIAQIRGLGVEPIWIDKKE